MKVSWSGSILWLVLSRPAQTQLASRCSSIAPDDTTVACVNNYDAVMPVPFSRAIATTVPEAEADYDSFRLTNVSDPSFALVRNATFIVFDQSRAQDILGLNPTYEFITPSEEVVHEAPVWVPWMNSIIFSLLSYGYYEQRLLNLSTSTPTVQNYTTSPPVYGVNGGRLFNGSIYWAVAGSGPFPDPSNTSNVIQQSPGIARLNPNTSAVEFLVNNYYGLLFNSPDDLVVDTNGDIFFTDTDGGYGLNVTSYFPPNPPITYRFRPSTGQVSVAENSINQPNGIGISPDGRTMYITATAEGVISMNNTVASRGSWDPYADRGVYAFDLIDSPPGKYLINKRPIWLPEEFFDDGFHVSAEGYLVGASGYGVDILSPYGELLVRITVTKHFVNNVAFVNLPGGGSYLYMFGFGGISRVGINLTGMVNE